ncbi:hypothetical protein [Bradyrhizobium sp. CCBAU 051011]|uniref:hypothetical protein n=1 Tax=Bradyrhizobium sp. CCBAU 051011 TaxID=858422 RepID=UPI00137A8E00|nr:hypothetical protein [Bradyrhizobium sp. CCBAU 051011]
MRTERAEGDADYFQRRRHAAHGHNTVALAVSALTQRTGIVLACQRELSNIVLATRLGGRPHRIGNWPNGFIGNHIAIIYDETPTSGPRTVEDEAVAELISKTLARRPKAAIRRSVRPSKGTEIAKSTVHCLFQLFGLRPRCSRSFKPLTDAFLSRSHASGRLEGDGGDCSHE